MRLCLGFLLVVFLFEGLPIPSRALRRIYKRQLPDGRPKPSRYKIPRPNVEANPTGVLVWIPDSAGIQAFHVTLEVNKEATANSSLAAGAPGVEEGNWVIYFDNVHLKVGDILHMLVKVVKYGRTYRLNGYRIRIEKFVDESVDEVVDEPPVTALFKPATTTSATTTSTTTTPSTTTTTTTTSTTTTSTTTPTTTTSEGPCEPSETTVNGKQVCGKTVVLDETFKHQHLFKSNKKLQDLLKAEMGSSVLEPKESNFMYYTREYGKAVVSSKTLIISPGFSSEVDNDDDFVEDGEVTISNCTSKVVGACDIHAFGWAIIPPILSARMTTKDVFSFRYGTIEIWAKLPKGNWIVPEIWLEQSSGDYRNFNGRIYMGYALGNANLKTSDGTEIGYDVKRQGYQIGAHSQPVFFNKTMPKVQGPDFHNYKLVWRPDSLSFFIDDELIKKLSPHTYLSESVKRNKLSPFDQEYHISIGLHAGGGADFPDGVTTGGKEKPWLNDDLKGMMNFWKSRTDWIHTWNYNSKLMISKIKVTSL